MEFLFFRIKSKDLDEQSVIIVKSNSSPKNCIVFCKYINVRYT